MGAIQFDPELIDSKLGDRRVNYPITIEPTIILRQLEVTFILQVIFEPKEIAANFRTDKYYLGIRNATIEIEAENGKCNKGTGDISFNVEYSAGVTRSKEKKENESSESQLSYKTVSVKSGQETSVGEMEEKTTTGRFSKNEKYLSSKKIHNRIRWVYTLPDNNSLISEVLDEILDLEATFNWHTNPLKGRIHLKPGVIEVFDSEKKRFPKYKNLAMIKVLYHKHIKMHKENIQINYEVL